MPECTHQGDCPGTCPQCDAELADIQRQLEEKGITNIGQDETLGNIVNSQTSVGPMVIKKVTAGIVPLMDDFGTAENIKAQQSHDIQQEEIPQFQRRPILECAVAGTGFHDINDIWDELYVGARLALVRERKNRYDKNAVAVACLDDYDGNPDEFDFNFILGYIPRTKNHAL